MSRDNSFVEMFRGFLVIDKNENYVKFVDTLVNKYCRMGYKMPLKVHIFICFP